MRRRFSYLICYILVSGIALGESPSNGPEVKPSDLPKPSPVAASPSEKPDPNVKPEPVSPSPSTSPSASPDLSPQKETEKAEQNALPVAPNSPPAEQNFQGAQIPEPDSGQSLKEIGVSVGIPSVINLDLGYWGSKSSPLLVRLSGAYYGQTRGIEFDLGYVFYREGDLKQYFAISAVSMQSAVDYHSFRWSDYSSYRDSFTGVGPSYGLNWRGLSLQIGLALGREISSANYSGGYSYPYGGSPVYNPPYNTSLNQLGPQMIFQLGYSVLW